MQPSPLSSTTIARKLSKPSACARDAFMGTAKRLTLSLLVLGLLTLGSCGKAFAQASPPPDKAEGVNPALWLVTLYREHISPIDGDRCPSLPTCSSYSVHAMEKHGFFLGWMMTVDRLIHEGQEETKVSPVVYHEGKWRIFDPVWNNDFWWHRPPATKGNSNERLP
jgi:Putative membrane protein insertion efficiency factor